jgi:hypothetical protein
MLEVETGVEMPEGSRRGGRPMKYGFHRLEVGQSIFVPGQSTSDGAYASAKQYARANGVRFSGRKVEGGVRIWRVG